MLVATGIFTAIALFMTVLAFWVKNGMLYAAGIVLWLVEGFLLYNIDWPTGNTYFQLAVIFVCLIFVIIMVAQTIIHYLSWRRSRQPREFTDDEIQATHRRKVLSITKKKDPWER
jgi:Na+/melibiose symporter-like transporter